MRATRATEWGKVAVVDRARPECEGREESRMTQQMPPSCQARAPSPAGTAATAAVAVAASRTATAEATAAVAAAAGTTAGTTARCLVSLLPFCILWLHGRK